MGRTADDYNPTDKFNSNTLLGQYMKQFKYGRTTALTCSWNTGLMPNPVHGCQGTNGLKNIFVDHIYKNAADPWQMIAAISGAHTLGSANPATSGFNGFWSSPGQQSLFNNGYYKSMANKGWGPELSVGGVSGKNQWKRIDGGDNPNIKEMMLDSDMCLMMNDNQAFANCQRNNPPGSVNCASLTASQAVPLLAANGNCCAWNTARTLFNNGDLKLGQQNQYCGLTIS